MTYCASLAGCRRRPVAQTAAARSDAALARATVDSDTRPATDHAASGDTGLWFVPTGEILPAKRWSVSAYRVNFDYQQGFTDISNLPVTFGVGIGDRVEFFGAWTLVRRIDRDSRADLHGRQTRRRADSSTTIRSCGRAGRTTSSATSGSAPSSTSSSEWRQQPVAFAVRGMVKLPTGDEDDGRRHGQARLRVDAIVSKEINQRVELSGYGGFIVRGATRRGRL